MSPDILGPNVVRIVAPGGDAACVSLWGGQVVSWETADGREHLYLSPRAKSDLLSGQHAAPLRGGVPICFPQFASRGNLPKHGWVRNTMWRQTRPVTCGDGAASASFGLRCGMGQALEHGWSGSFELDLCVTVTTNQIQMSLAVHNSGSAAWAFTAALHTYLALHDVRSAYVAGMKGVLYKDGLRSGEPCLDAEEEIRISDEVERVYRSAPQEIAVSDGQTQQKRLRVTQEGFADTVIWNPGPVKAAKLGDMPHDDWIHMICIEAAQIHQPVSLRAGETWHGSQVLSIYSKGING